MPEPRIDTTDWSTLSTAQRIKHLEIEGYVVFPPLVEAAEVEAIKAELDRLPTVGTDYSENQRGYSDVQWTDSPHAIELIAQPTMVDFLETLFGDELVCTSCVFALSQPGHPGIAIHTDSQPYGSKIFGMQASAPRLVRVLWYLDDLTPERSPLLVVPHSHLSLHADANPYKRYASHPEALMICCRPVQQRSSTSRSFTPTIPTAASMTDDCSPLPIGQPGRRRLSRCPTGLRTRLHVCRRTSRRLFKSLNTRNFDFDVPNRPANMANEAPGINPSRWDV